MTSSTQSAAPSQTSAPDPTPTKAPTPTPAWYREYHPRLGLSNGHLQTIVGNFLPRTHSLPTPDPTLVPLAVSGPNNAVSGSNNAVSGPNNAVSGPNKDEVSSVLCHSYWQPTSVRASRLTVILIHGLEGSSRSQYIIGNANKLWQCGANIICMNMRNCGGDYFAGDDYVDMELYTPTLYHSGMSSDVLAVAQHFIAQHGLQSIALAGYSMGGNLVLKLAGELGSGTLGNALPQLRAVVGISPLVDIKESADALHEPLNRVYEWKFLRGLIRRFRRKVELFPHRYSNDRTRNLNSMRQFDDRITAFYEGFANADDYYYRAAAARVVQHIAVPTLMLHALDDPFIRYIPPTRNAILSNPNITLLETAHGGHCAFLSSRNPLAISTDPIDTLDDGYWAESTLVRFLQSVAGLQPPDPDDLYDQETL